MVAPINTIKHYVQRPSVNVTAGTVNAHVVVDAAVAPANATTAEVIEGAVIRAIFVEWWILSQGGTGTEDQFGMIIEKIQNSAVSATFTNMLNLQAYDNKRNILYYTQGIISGNDTGSVNIFRQWVKIPKGKQRFAAGDRLVITTATVGQALALCGFVTYKEYR